jgi:hypothetical protein
MPEKCLFSAVVRASACPNLPAPDVQAPLREMSFGTIDEMFLAVHAACCTLTLSLRAVLLNWAWPLLVLPLRQVVTASIV